MSERLALCETSGLVVLPDAGELAFLDCVNGAADRGEGCPVLAQRRRRLDDPARHHCAAWRARRRRRTALHGGRELHP
jgi:hypothetical protein